MVKFLEWDSHFFNLKIGKSEADDLKQAKTITNIFKKSDYDLVYLFLPLSEEVKSVQEIANEYKPIDTKITYSKPIKKALSKLNISNFKIHDIDDQIINLGIQSGHHSRFLRDKKLRSGFESLYTEWIIRSVKKEIADVVFGIKDNRQNTLGLITIKKKAAEGIIGLMAVDQTAQRQGIGTKLLELTEIWCASENIRMLTVSTQLINFNACNFYQKHGFKKTSEVNIYHLWK